MKKTKNPKVMGRKDVAGYLNISPVYVDKLAEKGDLESQDTSSGRIFFERDVLRYEVERAKRRAGDKRFKSKKA